MSVIAVDQVYKDFGKGDAVTHVLNGASLSIEQGEFVSLMGASGSGKSTLLYLIGGLDRDYKGSIQVFGQELSALKEQALSALRLEKIGFIFQFYNLVQNLSVEDNILLPQRVRGRKNAELQPQLEEILALTGLSEKRKSMPGQLSGGQQQRCAIARAVMGNPALILADEPTGNLDTRMSEDVMSLFARINKEKGITILQVTHSPACAAYGTRTILLKDGSVVQSEQTSQSTTESGDEHATDATW